MLTAERSRSGSPFPVHMRYELHTLTDVDANFGVPTK